MYARWDRSATLLTAVTVLGLAAVVWWLYSDALLVGFLSDDWYFLRAAALLSPLDLFRLRTDPSDPQSCHYVPLGQLAYWIEYRAFALNATVWHAVNLLLHGLNAFLVSRVAQRAFGLARSTAVAAGLFYSVMFFHYESVLAVFGVFYLVAAFSTLVALLCYCEFLRNGGGGHYVAYHFGAMAALLTIEAGMVVPPLAALLELGRGPSAISWRARLLRSVRHQIPLALLYVGYFVFRAGGRTSMHEIPFVKVVGTCAYSLFGLFAFGIAPLYEQAFQHKRMAAAVLCVASGLVWTKGGTTVRLAMAAFVLAFSPHYFLSGLETRYFYLPGAFAAVASAQLATRLAGSLRFGRTAAPFVLAAVAALSSIPYRADRIRDFLLAGEITSRTLAAIPRDTARSMLAAGHRVVVVDAPGSVGPTWGPSFPAYVFGNGLAEAIAFQTGDPAVPVAVRFVRTGQTFANPVDSADWVDEKELAQMAASRPIVQFSRQDPREVTLSLPRSER